MTAKSKGKRRPEIKAIVVLGREPSGYKARETVAGSVLRVSGRNFGSKPESARILFDKIEARPFTTPYSKDELVVTAPLPPVSTSLVRVSVRRKGTSAPYKFAELTKPAC